MSRLMGQSWGEEFSVSDVFSTDTAFCCEEILFVTQRYDGIKRGGFVRRIEAKEDANGRTDTERQNN